MSLIGEALFVAVAGAVVLGAAAAASCLRPAGSAAVRHRILATAFLVVLALPGLLFLLPAPQAPSFAHGPSVAAAAGAGEAPSLAAGETEAGHREAADPPWYFFAPALLPAVALLRLAGLARAHRRAGRLAEAAVSVRDPGLLSDCARLQRELGLRAPVSLRFSDAVDGPMTVGLLRPCVLLPAEAADWPAAERESVLRHELAHVGRGDNLLLLAASVVAALHWFDPAAWWALARLRRTAECACDDAVLGGGVRASSYARVLLEHSRHPAPRPVPVLAAAAMPFARHARRRLTALLDPARDRRAAGRRATLASAGLLLLCVLLLTPLRPPAHADPDPSSPVEEADVAAQVVELKKKKSGFKVDLHEIVEEFREARALRRWHRDPDAATPLPDGVTHGLPGGWTLVARDALALPGAKYGCIFPGEEGYVRLYRQAGGHEFDFRVEAAPDTPPGGDEQVLNDLLGTVGLGVEDGRFRAYRISFRVDGENLPTFGGAQEMFGEVVTAFAAGLARDGR